MSLNNKRNSMPTISIIIPTYNRAHTISRTIDSILIQKFTDYEIIVVDDGSQDNTMEILETYSMKQKLRIIQHPSNKGAVAAKNTGFDHIQGQWFCILDSDDEMTPDALETLFNLLEQVHPDIDAITCNCIDSVTGEFSGMGIQGDQYLDQKTIIAKASGEFWGITKTRLLGEKRFNEHHPDHNILWYQINAVAKRYYLHKALRIYHTDGADRVTLQIMDIQKNIEKTAKNYKVLAQETFFLSEIQKYNPDRFLRICIQGYITNRITRDQEVAAKYWNRLQNISNLNIVHRFLLKLLAITPPSILKHGMPFKKKLRTLFSS